MGAVCGPRCVDSRHPECLRMRLRRLLEWWAEWEVRQIDHAAYTHTVWTTVSCQPSPGHPSLGHRVLCLDPPGPVWKASQAVAELPEDERKAIHWRYLEGRPVSEYRSALRRAHSHLSSRLFCA